MSKKTIAIIILSVVVLAQAGFGFYKYIEYERKIWHWAGQATFHAYASGRYYAEADYKIGKIRKLKMRPWLNEREVHTVEDYYREGPYVIYEWSVHAYEYTGREREYCLEVNEAFIDGYNKKMVLMHEQPEEYKKQVNENLKKWKTDVLDKILD